MKKKVDDPFLYGCPILDLHGETYETSKALTKIFIDDAFEIGDNKVAIIHGNGKGIIKEAVFETLKKDRRVSEFKLDSFNSGMTIAFLKKPKEKLDDESYKKIVEKYVETNIINSIKMKKLFGVFNYKIDFTNNRIFVIHAPNGCGKSHLLNYIKMFLNYNGSLLLTGPFESFEISINNNNYEIKPFVMSNIEYSNVPKCNYISDLIYYNFEIDENLKEITNRNKVKIFQEIMDDFFCFEKKVIVNDEKELRIIYDYDSDFKNPSILRKGDNVRFEELSSGEQFIIKLFYKLIFNLQNNSFVIIDEPELSLHIEWQEMLIKNIVKVVNIFDIYILIATHSPYIVNNSKVEVGVVEYEEEK